MPFTVSPTISKVAYEHVVHKDAGRFGRDERRTDRAVQRLDDSQPTSQTCEAPRHCRNCPAAEYYTDADMQLPNSIETQHVIPVGKTKTDRRERQRTITAHHEAGHALGYFLFRLPYHSLSIVPNSDSAGRIVVSPDDATCFHELAPHEIDQVIVTSFLGFAAEKKFCGRARWKYGSGDYIKAFNLAARWRLDLGADELDPHLRSCWERAKLILERPTHWTSVEKVAQRLLAEGELNSEDAGDIFVQNLRYDFASIYWRHGENPATSKEGRFQSYLVRRSLR